MKTFLLVMAACLLSLPGSVHAQATAGHALSALPPGAEPRVGRYVQLIVDDQGNGLAAGHFDFPFNPAVTTVVLFPEDIERGRGLPKPELELDIRGRTAALFTTRRRLKKDLQRNLTLFSKNISVGIMLTAVDDPDDAIALAVVRTRSHVEQWQAARADYVAGLERENEREVERRADEKAIEGYLAHGTLVQPMLVHGDVAPHAPGVQAVTISDFEGMWWGANDMLVSFTVQNTGATAFDCSRGQACAGRDAGRGGQGAHRSHDHHARRPWRRPAHRGHGGRLDIAADREALHRLGDPARAAAGAARSGERQGLAAPARRLRRHLAQRRRGLDESDATSIKGLGVRAQYAFNRYIAVEGEVMGASTGDARFPGVMYDGMQGDLVRSAALGRMQFGGVLRLGEQVVPVLRLGVGLQGASHSGTLVTATGDAPGPDVGFSFDALWHFGTGVELRLGEHLIAGIGLSAVVVAKSLAAEGISGSIEAGIHLGYAWKP